MIFEVNKSILREIYISQVSPLKISTEYSSFQKLHFLKDLST